MDVMSFLIKKALRTFPAMTAIAFVLSLSACISGTHPPDSYTDSSGKTTVFQTSKESCTSSCNEDNSKCMESDAARSSGVNAPAGMFGASAECHNDLKSCLNSCRAQ
jgi:hypothetical protein